MLDEISRVWMSVDDEKKMSNGSEYLSKKEREGDIRSIWIIFWSFTEASFAYCKVDFENLSRFRIYMVDSKNPQSVSFTWGKVDIKIVWILSKSNKLVRGEETCEF